MAESSDVLLEVLEHGQVQVEKLESQRSKERGNIGQFIRGRVPVDVDVFAP